MFNSKLINVLTIVSLWSITVNTIRPTVDESTMDSGVIYVISNVEDDSFIKIMSNVSYTCLIKFNCTEEPNSCTNKLGIQWLIPRKLIEYQLIHGKESSRISFDQQKYYRNGTKYFIVKSQMNITDVGAIYGGQYTCSHDAANSGRSINVLVEGRDKRGICNYDDQCLSENCFEHRCKCDPNEVYDNKTNKCYKVAQYGEPCTNQIQCTLNLEKSAARCSNGHCACKTGYTVTTRPLVGKMCLKMVSLNANCQESDQCSKSDALSFCSIKKVCECKTGYEVIENKCQAIKVCNSSELGENVNFIRGTCDQNEWCSNNVCLCLPNYRFNENNDCISMRTNHDNEEWYERYGWYIIGVLGVFLFMALIVIALQVNNYEKGRQTLVSVTTETGSREQLTTNSN